MGNTKGGKWKITGGKLIVTWPNGWKNIYTWVAGATSLSGVYRGPKGENNAITLTQLHASKIVRDIPVVKPIVEDRQEKINDNASKGRSYLVDLTPYGGKKGAPHKYKNIEMDDDSWIRLKSHGNDGHGGIKLSLSISMPKPIAASSIALMGNLDHAHLLPQGTTIARLVVITTGGEQRFDIKAGVHMSEWNGPVKHEKAKTDVGGNRYMPLFSLPKTMTVTGLRFEYVEAGSQYYHGGPKGDAPGFCLRGVTLIK
jgi:hypothetical protein